MAIQSRNPATGNIERSFGALSTHEVDQAIGRADTAFRSSMNASTDTRATWLIKAANLLRSDIEELSETMTREMGKTQVSARAEVEKCAWVCEFYAEHGAEMLADCTIGTDNAQSFVRHLPLGPVLAVMPWNFPLWQVFRFAAPALMAGNAGLLKHASNVPQCALAIEDIFIRAGVPAGLFQTLLIGGDQVEAILQDSRIKAATVTGSEGAGRAVAAQAGDALKKVVLELGGSDPFIVMPSANLGKAVDLAIKGRTQNNGQSCIAAKRFIVHTNIYSDFRDEFAARLSALTVGNPMEETTDIGPLATEDIRKDLDAQVQASIKAGAHCVVGCESASGNGWFYTPGLLDNIPDDAPAANEELFGPVASLFKVQSFDEAILRANATRFGLGSALFTQDTAEMQRAFDELEAGATFINAITASDPRLPFGGIKASGYGRELAEDGMKEFMNLKTCVIA